MAGEPGWVPPEAHTRRANPARIYDYLFGGVSNLLPGRPGRAGAEVPVDDLLSRSTVAGLAELAALVTSA